jgi:hypothetical protein
MCGANSICDLLTGVGDHFRRHIGGPCYFCGMRHLSAHRFILPHLLFPFVNVASRPFQNRLQETLRPRRPL